MFKTLISLFLFTHIGSVLADDSTATNNSNYNNDRYKKYVAEVIEGANQKIQALKSHFVCTGVGIGLIDEGSAMDGAIYIFYEDTKKLICVTAMGECVAGDPNHINSCREVCPPPEWKTNDCDAKYKAFMSRGSK